MFLLLYETDNGYGVRQHVILCSKPTGQPLPNAFSTIEEAKKYTEEYENRSNIHDGTYRILDLEAGRVVSSVSTEVPHLPWVDIT